MHWYSASAFLFSLVNKPGWAPVKLSQTGVYGSYNSYSMYSCYDRGPTLPVTPRPTSILTHSLDTPTVHHLATVIAAPSPNHSWQEALIFNQMKLKYFMKLLEANVSNQA